MHCKTLNLPQLQLSYLEWDTGQEPVLFLHGLADHAGVWLRAGDFLADCYHCVAPDLRGHGDSGKPARGYRCQDIIADLEALLAHLGWSSAHIVAHSWAAKVAVVWARQQPQRCRSLVLIDPFFINRLPAWMQITFPMLYRLLPFLKTMGPFQTYEQAEHLARSLKQYRGWSDFQRQVFQRGMEQKADGQWGSKFVFQARDETFLDVMQVAGLTEPISIPTLFLQPEQGLNRTAWQLQPYRAHLKQLQIQKVPGNHWCFLVEPEAFNAAIAAFLTQF
ncbi:alpha/beta hydrolase [Leptolyngbya sp. 'hensonii']|uniref:alpha/beta fold hydrolase n=1 Tax=Leptolyngbya sp. 'hensonii' TaxID=1922337 RepID=UPI00094F69A9|nr:alpha/beta hydrolase [Leptolyngbya sp. 'hensonii']OLP20487.1 alpha/beta hydrolase [Leptolyngbya sp. 'hensonii']